MSHHQRPGAPCVRPCAPVLCRCSRSLPGLLSPTERMQHHGHLSMTLPFDPILPPRQQIYLEPRITRQFLDQGIDLNFSAAKRVPARRPQQTVGIRRNEADPYRWSGRIRRPTSTRFINSLNLLSGSISTKVRVHSLLRGFNQLLTEPSFVQ